VLSKGDKVIIKKLYAHGADGEGVYLREGKRREDIGKLLIECEGMVLAIEKERVIKIESKK
jgi:hypothetical protein